MEELQETYIYECPICQRVFNNAWPAIDHSMETGHGFTMNLEEAEKRIQKLEEEMDTMKLSLRAAERFCEAFLEMLERWKSKK